MLARGVNYQIINCLTKSNTQEDLRRVFEKISDKFKVDLMPSGQVIVAINELWDNKVELDQIARTLFILSSGPGRGCW